MNHYYHSKHDAGNKKELENIPEFGRPAKVINYAGVDRKRSRDSFGSCSYNRTKSNFNDDKSCRTNNNSLIKNGSNSKQMNFKIRRVSNQSISNSIDHSVRLDQERNLTKSRRITPFNHLLSKIDDHTKHNLTTEKYPRQECVLSPKMFANKNPDNMNVSNISSVDGNNLAWETLCRSTLKNLLNNISIKQNSKTPNPIKQNCIQDKQQQQV